MVGIDSVVDSERFACFPLAEDAVGSEVDVLIEAARPPGVVDVGIVALDVYDFPVDPLVLDVPDVDILAQVVLQLQTLLVHTKN